MAINLCIGNFKENNNTCKVCRSAVLSMFTPLISQEKDSPDKSIEELKKLGEMIKDQELRILKLERKWQKQELCY